MFKCAELDPTVIAGGIINAWGTNARIGQGEWMVVEADESDGTFLKLPTQIGVVTNIDPEHMDYWPSLEALHQAFHQFIEAIPFYGLAVACIDHPVVRELLAKLGGAANGRRTLTYGVARDADIRLSISVPITTASPSTPISARRSRAARASSKTSRSRCSAITTR